MTGDSELDLPWRVGVLFSQTGVTAAVEQTQLSGDAARHR